MSSVCRCSLSAEHSLIATLAIQVFNELIEPELPESVSVAIMVGSAESVAK